MAWIATVAGLTVVLGMIHAATAIIWVRRATKAQASCANVRAEDVTVIVPVAALTGKEAALALGAAEHLGPAARLIYCAFAADEPAAIVIGNGLARLGLSDNPRIEVAVGRAEISRNPKLDNIAKAYDAARTDHLVCIDGNVIFSADYVARICADWGAGVTALSATPRTTDERNFWAFFEGAVLNLSHGRWLVALDLVGQTFAHGKLLAFRKSWLEAQGGFAALHCKRAEDTALTTLVHRSGGCLRLTGWPVLIPLGSRQKADVLARNFRWRFLRSRDLTAGYLAEPLSANWFLAGLAALVAQPAGLSLPVVAASVWLVIHLIEVWSWWRVAGRWSSNMHTGLILRDLTEPFFWCLGWWLWRQRGWRVATSSSRDTPSAGSE